MDVTPGHGVQTKRLYPESCSQSELSEPQQGPPPVRRLTKNPKSRTPEPKPNSPLRHKDTKNLQPLPARPFPNPLAIAQRGPDGWTLLVNPDNAAAIALNPTGALIWKLANGRRTVADIITGVRRHYPDAPDTVEADVTEHLATLSEAGLLGQEILIDSGLRTKDQGRMSKNQRLRTIGLTSEVE